MFTFAYLKSLGERAVVAFATSLGALLTAGGVGLLDAPWQQSLSVAGMAALLSVLTAFAPTGSRGPALTSAETERTVVEATS
jgi:hypothetical protein